MAQGILISECFISFSSLISKFRKNGFKKYDLIENSGPFKWMNR